MISIFIADDHQLFIDGIKSLLRGENGVKVIGEALNGKLLIEELQSKTPDIVLMDINMPEMDGIEATKILAASFPEIRVIVLSMHSNKEFILGLVEAGASGYSLKNSGKKELMAAINRVMEGKTHFGEEITTIIMDSLKNPAKNERKQEIYRLSDREKEVLKLIAQECSTKEIAERLFTNTNTVETHRRNLFAKLKVKNLAGLVKYAVQTGLIE